MGKVKPTGKKGQVFELTGTGYEKSRMVEGWNGNRY